jgi:hypothetical protein
LSCDTTIFLDNIKAASNKLFLSSFLLGFSYKNNSIFIFLGLAIGLMVLLQPFIMRYSRVIWLSVFVKYQSNEKIERES